MKPTLRNVNNAPSMTLVSAAVKWSRYMVTMWIVVVCEQWPLQSALTNVVLVLTDHKTLCTLLPGESKDNKMSFLKCNLISFFLIKRTETRNATSTFFFPQKDKKQNN